jgi:uroporphyrin-III C-methyltransferase / precorrin-2 dehydrogenase / sirohydrochlorin ferrochelatase
LDKPMLALPLSLPLTDKRIVLLGAGPWLERKLELVRRTPAKLEVYTDIWPDTADIEGAALMIVAFEDRGLAQKGAALARTAHVPLNVVDFPDLGDVHIPAIIDRGPISIGVASGGTAPVLARETRRKIEAAVPPSDTQVALFAERLSPILRKSLPDVDTRRRFWEDVLVSPAADMARSGDINGALLAAQAQLNINRPLAGIVHLVGAGPGNPELLTLKALRLLSQADVIVYDRLVGQEVMDMARRDAERLYVGKERSNHSIPQEDIHALLVEKARQGKRVVRLKGGDPFIFGRGGEEVEALIAAGIKVEITPGITAALGCAASTLTPLTHRDHANGVTFITGHAKDGDPDKNALSHDWQALAMPHHTLVVYMGVHTSKMVSERLIAYGRAKDTPVVVIENGTRVDERVRYLTLATLTEALKSAPPSGPTLVIIGEVAGLSFGAQSLKGIETALKFKEKV